MKKLLAVLLGISLLVPSFAGAETQPTNEKVIPGEYLIAFEPHEKDTKLGNYTKHIEKLVEAFDGEVITIGQEIHYAHVKLPNDKVADALENQPGILSVDPNELVPLNDTPPAGWNITDPNTVEWGGWGYDLVKNANIHNLKGDGVKVMVIDDGVYADHPDMNYERVITDHLTYPDTADGTHGMGTTGIIGAQHNGKGAMGIAPNARLFAFQADEGTGSYDGLLNTSHIIKGYDWAIVNGMDLINASYSQSSFPITVKTALDEIIAAGIQIVGSAGNDYQTEVNDGTRLPNYPADYPGVMNISALEETGKLANYSERGDTPGDPIDFTAPTNTTSLNHPLIDATADYYKNNFGGTSAAAPHVTGVMALYKQAYPHYTMEQLLSLAKSQATNIGLPSSEQGAGRIKAPQTISGKTINDLMHGFALYTSITATSYSLGNSITVHSRLMDDPTTVTGTTANPERPYERPFELANIRHTVTKVGGGDSYTIVKAAGTDGRHDTSITVNTTNFPTAGEYDIITRASYTDPVTGQYCYTYKSTRITRN